MKRKIVVSQSSELEIRAHEQEIRLKRSINLVPMSLDSAVHVAMYDQRVFALLEAQAGQHQSCTHHS